MANLQRIKDLAEERKISIRDLAERVGVKENQIHVMCRTNSTKIDTLERIAQVFNVHVSEFFDDAPPIVQRNIEGNNNQLNERGAHGNINGGTDPTLQERIKSLQDLMKEKDKSIARLERELKTSETRIAEKDERIAELKEKITELKRRR